MSFSGGIADSASLRDRLRGGGLKLAWFAMGSVPLLEMGMQQQFDAGVIDLQHGLWDRMSTHLAVSAAGQHPILMRTAANSVAAIGEALDSGARGVLIPLIETAEAASAAVAAATFPSGGKRLGGAPAGGVRSGGGVRPLAEGFSLYFKRNADPLIGVMIETVEGVRNAAAIAAVPGIDFVFLGTGDLALSIGCFPEIDERHEEACATVFAACRTAGIPCGIFTSSPDAARRRLEEGYAAVVAANDIDVTTAGFAAAADAVLGLDHEMVA